MGAVQGFNGLFSLQIVVGSLDVIHSVDVLAGRPLLGETPTSHPTSKEPSPT
jgi:hypothetical protein